MIKNIYKKDNKTFVIFGNGGVGLGYCGTKDHPELPTNLIIGDLVEGDYRVGDDLPDDTKRDELVILEFHNAKSLKVLMKTLTYLYKNLEYKEGVEKQNDK